MEGPFPRILALTLSMALFSLQSWISHSWTKFYPIQFAVILRKIPNRQDHGVVPEDRQIDIHLSWLLLDNSLAKDSLHHRSTHPQIYIFSPSHLLIYIFSPSHLSINIFSRSHPLICIFSPSHLQIYIFSPSHIVVIILNDCYIHIRRLVWVPSAPGLKVPVGLGSDPHSWGRFFP